METHLLRSTVGSTTCKEETQLQYDKMGHLDIFSSQPFCLWIWAPKMFEQNCTCVSFGCPPQLFPVTYDSVFFCIEVSTVVIEWSFPQPQTVALLCHESPNSQADCPDVFFGAKIHPQSISISLLSTINYVRCYKLCQFHLISSLALLHAPGHLFYPNLGGPLQNHSMPTWCNHYLCMSAAGVHHLKDGKWMIMIIGLDNKKILKFQQNLLQFFLAVPRFFSKPRSRSELEALRRSQGHVEEDVAKEAGLFCPFW